MKKYYILFLTSLISLSFFAENKVAYKNYINKYKDIAIEQQNQYKIPASITLAQGLLESGAGLSTLAKKSNNHFGIKCHDNWNGKKTIHFDDGIYSCFRKYKKPEDSYIDHSLFLVGGQRYKTLFNLDVTDYKHWAYGLKKAGYATDKHYPEKLIKIIKDYKLYDLTKGSYNSSSTDISNKKPSFFKRLFSKNTYTKIDNDTSENKLFAIKSYNYKPKKKSDSKDYIPITYSHKVNKKNHNYYITTVYGDNYESLYNEFKISKRKIIKYNDLDKKHVISPGEIIYLQKKEKWWDGPSPFHIVKKGETMFSISQEYGLDLSKLLDINNLKRDAIIKPNDKIKLRDTGKMSVFYKAMNKAVN